MKKINLVALTWNPSSPGARREAETRVSPGIMGPLSLTHTVANKGMPLELYFDIHLYARVL